MWSVLRSRPVYTFSAQSRAIISPKTIASKNICVRFASGAPTSAPKAKENEIRIHHLGVGADIYIHPSKLPSFFTSPRLRFRGFVRLAKTFALNTLQVAMFRFRSGLKPRFVEWKNEALKTYVEVNEAFTNKNLAPVDKKICLWVNEALSSRIKSLPKNTDFRWKLLKVTSPPKLMNFQYMMLPNYPPTVAQVTYRLETKQRLVRSKHGEREPIVVDRDVTDYVSFMIDASTVPSEVMMLGTVFETPLNGAMPIVSEKESDAIASMVEKGDVFRASPKDITFQEAKEIMKSQGDNKA
ncbi:MBA1-domain-containing protein [Nadsonia fulvescens var. elongata DSM 6958]|uniref:MBA1-domain-containing protein n=1 Tax=Nadsonia fulvescens var. elongata DSM 6958 TaxID=857566 RepID=A0A1E3PSE6_9ASCO|nr:MBA1-domain-containing protein [Nadsonia fulvescens var. elongata DSM 6958]